MINETNVKNSKLRDQFEQFLNKYNISHISFNFLGNELFNKTGKALELEQELTTFRERIKNISQTLQEQRYILVMMTMYLMHLFQRILLHLLKLHRCKH